MIEDGNVNVTGFVKLFFEGGTKDVKELSPKWQEIVKKSIATCESEFPTKWLEVEAKYVNFYTYFVLCIRKMNFLNCQEFKGTDQCARMKRLMDSCTDKDYDFLQKILFEEFYVRANEKGG